MATKIRVFPRNAVIDRRIFKTEKPFKYSNVPSPKLGVEHDKYSISVNFSKPVQFLGFIILKKFRNIDISNMQSQLVLTGIL